MSKAVDEVQQTLLGVTDSRASEDCQSLNDLMEPIFDKTEVITNSGGALFGVPAGFNELSSLTNDLHSGQMIIVTARPGVGKSTFALGVYRTVVIHHDLATVFFSLEMSHTEIVVRVLSMGVSVPLQEIHGGRMDENDWQHITDHSVILSGKPLFIDDSPSLTTVGIHAKVRHLRQCNNPQLVCIDYTQLMISGRKVESRQLRVSEFSRQTKLPAKKLEAPVIALSQLSRSAEQRKGGVPQLTDLCRSGSFKRDADIVIMLRRPESYTQNPADEGRGQATFHILKYRNDQFDKINALFQDHYSRFTNQPVATFSPT